MAKIRHVHVYLVHIILYVALTTGILDVVYSSVWQHANVGVVVRRIRVEVVQARRAEPARRSLAVSTEVKAAGDAACGAQHSTQCLDRIKKKEYKKKCTKVWGRIYETCTYRYSYSHHTVGAE